MFENVPGYNDLSPEDESTVLSSIVAIGQGKEPLKVLHKMPQALRKITLNCIAERVLTATKAK